MPNPTTIAMNESETTSDSVSVETFVVSPDPGMIDLALRERDEVIQGLTVSLMKLARDLDEMTQSRDRLLTQASVGIQEVRDLRYVVRAFERYRLAVEKIYLREEAAFGGFGTGPTDSETQEGADAEHELNAALEKAQYWIGVRKDA